MDGVEVTQSVEVQAVSMVCDNTHLWLHSVAICPDLTVPANGVISYSPDRTPRLEGTVATHSCLDGYRVSGGTERTCQSDRTWSGGDITCLRESLPVCDIYTMATFSLTACTAVNYGKWRPQGISLVLGASVPQNLLHGFNSKTIITKCTSTRIQLYVPEHSSHIAHLKWLFLF